MELIPVIQGFTVKSATFMLIPLAGIEKTHKRDIHMDHEKIEIIQINDRRIAIVTLPGYTDGHAFCRIIDDVLSVINGYKSNSLLPLIKTGGFLMNEKIALRMKHLFEHCIRIQQDGAIVIHEDYNFDIASIINRSFYSDNRRGFRVFNDTAAAMQYLLFNR